MDRAHRPRRGSLARWRIGNYVVALMVLASLIPALSGPVLAEDGEEIPAASERHVQGPLEPVQGVPTRAPIPTETPPPTEVPAPTETPATEGPPPSEPAQNLTPDPTEPSQLPAQLPVQETAVPTAGILAEPTPAAIGLAWYLCPDDATVPTTVSEARTYPCIEFGENGMLATFDLYYGPTHAGSLQLGPMTGAGFNNLIPDNYTIRQASPLPGTFSVFCESSLGGSYEAVSTSGGGAFVQTTPGEIVRCDWFSTIGTPSEPVEYGSSVVVRVWECPPEISDLSSATTLIEVAQLKGQCDPHHDGELEFSLRAEGASDILFPIDNLTSYIFRNVPLGALELSAMTTFGAAATYCAGQPHDGSGVSAPTLSGTGQTAQFEIDADEDMNCDVLAVMLDGNGSGTTPEATPTGTPDAAGTLRLIPRNCPASYQGADPLLLIPADLDSACLDPIGDVSFTVNSGAYSQTLPVDPATGEAVFNGVPGEPISIQEVPEGGYTTLIVTCFVDDQLAEPLPEGTPTDAQIEDARDALARNEITIPLTLRPDFNVPCSWFNVPDGQEPGATPAATTTVTPTMTPTAPVETPTVTVTPTDVPPITTVEATPDVDIQGTPGTDAQQEQVPAELSVTAYWCPGLYDVRRFGADPTVDYPGPMDGATFSLDQPGDGPVLTGISGDNGPGGVVFSGLTAGNYTLTHSTSDPVEKVLTWDCVGMSTGAVQPRPLTIGSSLVIGIASGDTIHCRWYAVPAMTQPAVGSMTVVAYDCTTSAYVSEVDCLVDQDGRMLELRVLDGGTWSTIGSGTTDGTGEIVFLDLVPGNYAVVEADATHCLSRSDLITEDGKIGVSAGRETTVKIYTCGQPMKPPVVPTKFPNTGVTA